MPDANVAKTLIRVFDLLRLLPRHSPGKTAGAMHEELLGLGYEIEKRTIERDLRMLQSAFPEYLGCDDKTKPFGWHWLPGKELCITNIQAHDALVLGLVAETLQATLPAPLREPLTPRFTQARLTLQKQLAAGSSQACPFAYIPAAHAAIPPDIEPAAFELIVSALLAKEQIEAGLPAEEDTDTVRVSLTPVALLQHGSITRLIGFRNGSQSPEHFALHRLHQPTRLNRHGEALPQSFVLEKFIASLAGSATQDAPTDNDIRLIASISDKLRQELLDAPLSSDQFIARQENGWRLRATVTSGSWLLSWILQRGAAIRIEEPATLRAAVCAEISSMTENYSLSTE